MWWWQPPTSPYCWSNDPYLDIAMGPIPTFEPLLAKCMLVDARDMMAKIEPQIKSLGLGSPLANEYLKHEKYDEWTDEQHFRTPLETANASIADFRMVFTELGQFAHEYRIKAAAKCDTRRWHRPDDMCYKMVREMNPSEMSTSLDACVNQFIEEMVHYFDDDKTKLFAAWKQHRGYKTVLTRYIEFGTIDSFRRLQEEYADAKRVVEGISIMLATQRLRIPHIAVCRDGIINVYHRKPHDEVVTFAMRQCAFDQCGQDPVADLAILEALKPVFPPELTAIIFNYARSGSDELHRPRSLRCDHNHTNLQECLL